MDKGRPSIAHVVPGMYFGGVEVGILKSYQALNQEFDYDVYFVRKKGELDVGQSSSAKLLKRVLIERKRPDLIITSLWWGHLNGIFLSLLGVKWACFIHSTGHSSVFDFIITRLALIMCSNHIFDSATSRKYFSSYKSRHAFVVPYVFNDENSTGKFNKEPEFTFSWIGRNSKEKRLDLLVSFIRSLQAKRITFNCYICIAGDRDVLIDELAMESRGSVVVQYNVAPEHIRAVNMNSEMTMCFSDYEGFSVTTAEAAMRGNLICARRVGELSNYLCEKSTIWLDDLSQDSWNEFMGEVVACLRNKDDFLERRYASHKYTSEILSQKSYISAMSKGLRALVDVR